jgi:hypothetical protein
LIWLLAAALLFAQLLGLMHGVVHGPQAHIHSHSHVHHGGRHQQEHSALAHAEDERAAGLAGLAVFLARRRFGLPPVRPGQPRPGGTLLPLLSLPLVLCSVAFDISRGEALARWAALFDARGPPSTR